MSNRKLSKHRVMRIWWTSDSRWPITHIFITIKIQTSGTNEWIWFAVWAFIEFVTVAKTSQINRICSITYRTSSQCRKAWIYNKRSTSVFNMKVGWIGAIGGKREFRSTKVSTAKFMLSQLASEILFVLETITSKIAHRTLRSNSNPNLHATNWILHKKNLFNCFAQCPAKILRWFHDQGSQNRWVTHTKILFQYFLQLQGKIYSCLRKWQSHHK